MSDRSAWAGLSAQLSPAQDRRLAGILKILAEDEHSPTAVRDPRRAAAVHIADSLAALQLAELRRASRIADLGSGAGFPGLPLAVALPTARVNLVESQRRKCDFLARVCDAVGIENAQVVCARAENWPDGLGRNEAVVARALASQPVVLEYAAPLLCLGGVLVDWRGRRSPEDEGQADRAAEILGLQRTAVHRIAPLEDMTDHHLHVFVKAAETPPRFPRRPGMARKRPLGG